MIYMKHSPWLNIRLKLNSNTDDELSKIARNISLSTGGSGRSDSVKNLTSALSVMYANLLKQYAVHPDVNIQIDLSNDGYQNGPFNPLGINIASIRKVFYYLKDNDKPLIKTKGGNYDRIKKIGYPTQLMATNGSIDIIIDLINNNKSISDHTKTITRKTFNYEYYLMFNSKIFELERTPSIRMKDKSSKIIEFNETDETRMISTFIEEHNFSMKYHHIDLFIPNTEFEKVRNNSSDYDDIDEVKRPVNEIDMILKRDLYRVFNDGTFDHGGRFYGGWWQNIPSEYRRFLTLDSIPTVELDFANMQLAMLYAKIGLNLEGDAYAIAGIDPK